MQTNPGVQVELPEPDETSAAHSERVVAHIAAAIESAGGSISFAEYMQLALYAPGLGYYSAGAEKLGPDGDFTTAPEISPLFGRVLARQAALLLDQLGGGDVLEPGAGTGALAVTMLQKFEVLDSLPHRYLILEVSADLRERQERRIRSECPHLLQRVQWIAELPGNFTGVVIANEIADALPVERFRIERQQIMQARVTTSQSGFAWQYEPAPDLLREAVREVETCLQRRFDDGYESEVSLALSGWTQDLASAVESGAILLIDYGVSRREYYAPERRRGWLRCHFRHRAHDDPLVLAGIQDLTAWVDFSAVAAAGASAGMSVSGYVTQAQLMLHGGLEDELADFPSLPVSRQVELSGQVKLLTLPGEMGENFKCMILSRGDIHLPPALLAADRAHLL